MIVAHVYSRRTNQVDEGLRSVWFGRLDARAKLVGVFAFVLVTALLTDTYLVLFALAVGLVLLLSSRLPIAPLAKMYLAALPFILFASASVFLFGGWHKSLAMWARTSACVIPLLVLAAGTETFDLFAGLRRLRVPSIITTLLMLTQRYILLLTEELSRMTVARRARGYRGARSLLDRFGLMVLANTAGMVLVRSFKRADVVYEGLKCKAFDREMTPWRTSRIATLDAVFILCLVAVAFTLLAAQLGAIG